MTALSPDAIESMLEADLVDIDTGKVKLSLSAMQAHSGGVLIEALDFDDLQTVLGRMLITQHGQIDVIEAHPAWLRHGIATAMYRYASDFLGPIAHSADRSDDGDAWARSLGQEIPARSHQGFDISQFNLWSDAIEQAHDDPVLAATLISHFPESAGVLGAGEGEE